jgi:hypothetical protein
MSHLALSNLQLAAEVCCALQLLKACLKLTRVHLALSMLVLQACEHMLLSLEYVWRCLMLHMLPAAVQELLALDPSVQC